MTEHLKRHYLKEEEFLGEFGSIAEAAAKYLDGAWKPDYLCNDNVRNNTRHFLQSGDLTQLRFDSADVYHDSNGCFSSALLILKSAKRIMSVRVRRTDDGFAAETIVDRVVGDAE